MTARGLGLLGGTFDPVHNGHLHLAEAAREQLGLARVLLIPAGRPWQRSPVASSQDRLNMVRLAISDHLLLGVDDCEVKREGPTYTIDTLREFRNRLGTDNPLWLIVGADAMNGLHTWQQWQKLFDYAHLVVANRPDHEWRPEQINDAAVREFLHQRFAAPANISGAAGALCSIQITPMNVASTQIRNSLAQGQSVTSLIPEAVAQYIHQHQLYRPKENA